MVRVMFGNFVKIGRAAVYYYHDRIKHLNVKFFNRFIQLFSRTILDVNIIFSLSELKFGAFVR